MPPPAENPSGLDPARQEKARQFARTRRYLLFVDLGLGLVVILLFLSPGRGVAHITSLPVIASAVVYFLIIMAVYGIISFPLSYYEFVLSKRYGLSIQKLSGWLKDEAKSAALGVGFGSAAVAALYWFIIISPSWWWFIAWGGLLLITLALSYLAPIILLPLFIKMKPLGDRELKQKLEALAMAAGARIKGIYAADFSARGTTANAALIGMGNTRRIMLADTLLMQYTVPEIEDITAHELGHYHYHHALKIILSQAVVLLVLFFVASLIYRHTVLVLGFTGVSDVAAMPWLGIIFGFFGLLTMPILNNVTRALENQADDFALRTTHNPEAFISAMTKLTDQNLGEAESAAWIEFLLHDHPSYKARIRHAEKYRTPPVTGV